MVVQMPEKYHLYFLDVEDACIKAAIFSKFIQAGC
jgi:hypothetical protein